MENATPSVPAKPIQIEVVHQVRDHCLCLAAQRAARLLARRFDRRFAPLGLNNVQFSMMVALCGAWTPRLGQLAELLAMDQATVTAAVKTLAKRGLVDLQADAGDGRVRRPVLTAAGRALVAAALPLWQDEHARVEAELSTDARALALVLTQLR